jgi:hypothetical protein
LILIGTKLGIVWIANIVAVSSPIWFDWFLPGILIARFLGSLSPNQIPAPHFAFSLPLLKHAPSVYTSTVSCRWLVPAIIVRFAGFLGVLPGSVKTRKHSAREFFVVIEGSKSTSSFLSLAKLFRCFLFGVREKFPWCSSWASGFSIGNVMRILIRASCAHSCGVQQCVFRSSQQSLHRQKFDGRWGLSGVWFRRRAEVLRRSAMVFVLCLVRRHFDVLLLMGRFSEPTWNHAGSCVFSRVSSLMAECLGLSEQRVEVRITGSFLTIS